MPFLNPLPGVPYIESPFFDDIFREPDYDPQTIAIARELRETGFVVIDFPDPEISVKAGRIKAALTPQYDWQLWHNVGWSQNE